MPSQITKPGMKQTLENKHCRRCRGFCPSGTLDNKLCLDCLKLQSPEEEQRRKFALALAARSPYWHSVVWNASLVMPQIA